jgi:plastocyanin domain-containing protein
MEKLSKECRGFCMSIELWVNVGGVALIALIVWWFWLSKQ